MRNKNGVLSLSSQINKELIKVTLRVVFIERFLTHLTKEPKFNG